MYYFVYITASNEEEAKNIAKILLEKRLAACINYWKINSLYWWNDEIQEDDEYVIIAKTRAEKFSEIKEEVKKVHSYTTPCICALNVEEGERKFLDWIDENVE